MALNRRNGSRFEANIWPGFVDAMTALLLVLMFVLTIFMFLQYVLQETISGQRGEIDQLTFELTALAEVLGLEQQRGDRLERDLSITRSTLSLANDTIASQTALISGLRADNADAQARIASFEEQVASLLARNDELGRTLAAARTESAERGESLRATEAEVARLETELSEEISASEALRLALASARDEIDAQAEAARLAAAQREALELLVADLKDDLAGRKATLAELAADLSALEDSEATLHTNLTGTEETLAAIRTGLAERDAELEKALAELSDTELVLLAAQGALTAAEAREEGTAADLAETETALLSTEEALAAARARLTALEADLEASERERLREAGAAAQLRALLAEIDPDAPDELAGRAAAEALRRRLAEADAEMTAMTLALEEQRREAEETLTLLAAAEVARTTLETARADDLSELDRQRALIATANRALTDQRTQATEARRRVTLLNQQAAELSRQIATLQGLLNAAEARDAANAVQIEALGSRLNSALAQVASDERRRAAALEAEARDLRNYRSEFFGQLRELLGERDGVRIVGDRFVFSSKVLFAQGDATLGPRGQAELSRVADVLLEVAGEIPAEINWILRVDGHTDIVPINSPRFANNWELSQARALSVVLYLINERGLPADRLAATGFGEHQSITTGTSPADLARNRRIELKLTER